MPEIILTPRELLFISAQLEAVEFLGVSDAFFGMEDGEIQRELLALQSSLEKKGYAEIGVDGEFTLHDSVRETVHICAHCDTYIIADKNKMDKPRLRELYYAKNGKIIILCEEEKDNKLTQISNVDELARKILHGIEWQSSESKLQKIK
ncbi:MAG: hypothetical protein LBI27_07935, partial [Clostridiales bacterium]|nr:hypothetical protein [Clostridiales bacterium]